MIKHRLALVLFAASVCFVLSFDRVRPTGEDGGLSARVDRLVREWEPIAAERRLDEVGWAKDIRDALRLAREHKRPIFLFTYSGSADREHAMALQRC
jgi:hypothetical protein